MVLVNSSNSKLSFSHSLYFGHCLKSVIFTAMYMNCIFFEIDRKFYWNTTSIRIRASTLGINPCTPVEHYARGKYYNIIVSQTLENNTSFLAGHPQDQLLLSVLEKCLQIQKNRTAVINYHKNYYTGSVSLEQEMVKGRFYIDSQLTFRSIAIWYCDTVCVCFYLYIFLGNCPS